MISDDDDDNDHNCAVESVGKVSHSRCTSTQSLKQDPLANKENDPFQEPGGRFSKVPKTFRAICKTPTRLFCKACLFISCRENKK